MSQSRELLFVTRLLLLKSSSVMSEDKKAAKSRGWSQWPSPASQPCSYPGLMNMVINLLECFHCKGRYLMSVVQEIDLALSLFFYCIIFFWKPKNIFAEPAQYSLFTTLITGFRKYFLAFPKSHTPQNLLAKWALARDLIVTSSSLTCVSISVSFRF